MKNNVYLGNFEDWNDVQREFNTNEPEPKEVIYANYDMGGYDGSAFVVYRNGRKYYLVQGGHCSCYGLEDQWNPEEYSKKILVAALERMNYPEDAKEVLKRLKNK